MPLEQAPSLQLASGMPLSWLAPNWFETLCGGMARSLDRSPWTALEPGERMRLLPELITALVRHSAGSASPRATETDVLKAACDHGQCRAFQGLQEAAVLDEYYLLRNEVFQLLRTHLGTDGVQLVLARFDEAISHASVAALRCMHGLSQQDS